MVARSTSKNSTWLGLVLSSLGWLLPNAVMTPSSLAAERIYFSYGAIERTISVASLEAYAKEGKIDDDLATYAEYVSPQRLIQLQRVLQARIQLSPVAVSQFLYTPVLKLVLRSPLYPINQPPPQRDRKLIFLSYQTCAYLDVLAGISKH